MSKNKVVRVDMLLHIKREFVSLTIFLVDLVPMYIEYFKLIGILRE